MNGGPVVNDNTGVGSALTHLGDIDGDGLPNVAVGASYDSNGGLSFATRGSVFVMNLASTLDFGDAPDATAGSATEDYSTLLAHDGARHVISDDLLLGATIDGDTGTRQNTLANADDIFGGSDEDGVLSPLDLQGTEGAAPSVTVLATNSRGSAATVYGWIDYNHDGVFDNATERAQVNVPDAVMDGRFTLTFPTIPSGSSGDTYARFRISTDAAAADPTGLASDGEVEDYVFSISSIRTGVVSSTIEISNQTNGGPALEEFDRFGNAVTPLGDMDGDGVPDLAVGARDDGFASSKSGAVYTAFMNIDGTVKSLTKIARSEGGAPAITSGDRFGSSVANIGDLNGDGVTDLAVGAMSDYEGGTLRGAAYVLFMKSDGSVASSTKIAHQLNGGPSLLDGDYFGSAVANLGDLDGDGVQDLAVGARWDDTGGSNPGAVHILFMNANGTVKASTKLSSGVNGAPTLADSDYFGTSLAALGDLDGDGVADLAVGAAGDDTGGLRRGAVHVLFMNSDGTVKSSSKIASGSGPTLPNNARFGHSVASIGDLDGDGIDDLGVGAVRDSTGGTYRGALHVLLMNSDGTAKSASQIASGINGGPPLGNFDFLGNSVAAIGDVNGDGVSDIAVASENNGNGSDYRGAVHVLFMDAYDPTTITPVITTATDQVFSDNQFGLDWDAVPGAEGYEVWYTYATTGAAPFIQQTVMTNSFTPSAALPIGRYFIWVRVKQDDGSTSAWSTPINATVSVPAVLDPIEFQQTDLTPTVSWAAIPGATRYEIWGNNVTTGTSQIITDTNIVGTSFTPGSDLPFGRYRVWVRGYDAANVPSAWSAPIQFSIGPQPVAPLGPTFESTPTFEWTTIPGAATYELYLSTAGGIVQQTGLTGSSWTPAGPLPNGILRWWVRGATGGGTPGAWSDRIDSDIGGRPVMQTPIGNRQRRVSRLHMELRWPAQRCTICMCRDSTCRAWRFGKTA